MKALVFVLLVSSIFCEQMNFLDIPKLNDNFQGLIKILEDCLGTWNKFKNAFETTKNSTVKSELKGKGFKKFVGSGDVFFGSGIKGAFWSDWSNDFLEFIDMPEKFTKQIKNYLKMMGKGDSSAWNKYDIEYTKESHDNKVFSATVIGNYNEKTDKYYVAYSTIDAQFDLSPDTVIMDQSIAHVGGIFNENKIVYEEHTKELNTDELKAITTFFQVVSISVMAEEFGFKVPLPY